MSAKAYALYGGIILLVLGVIGILGGNTLLGLNSEPLEDIIHIVAGGLLTWAGYRGGAAQQSMWSKVFGVVFLVVGIVGFFNSSIFGLFRQGMATIDNIVHLIYGVLGAMAGFRSRA